MQTNNKQDDYFQFCIYYKERDLPAARKTDSFKRALILDSLLTKEHPINNFIESHKDFVPYLNERDKLGNLISSNKRHRKSKSNGSLLNHTPKISHLLGSKNSISNTNSIIDNTSTSGIAKYKLKNMLGMSQENTDYFPSLHVSSCDFKVTNSFTLNKPKLAFSRKNSDQKKCGHLSNQQQQQNEPKYPQYSLLKVPRTPIATRMYQRNFIVEAFRKNRIPKNVEVFVLFMEKVFKFQDQYLRNLSAKERRVSFIRLDNRKRFKLSLLLLISKQTQFAMLSS